ncbi:hypothetical protein ACFVIM_00745 [Streptomyces sp. NPDC057638]|uniref:hypothetical protein n=1 Tax=Streptomyces sp. NPDC057638 TaxID=3346190 RepID=UPI0036C963CA
MPNDIQSMRNINNNLFDCDPSANALNEYDSDAEWYVREAAQQLVQARSANDHAALEEADSLTRHAAAHLLDGAGRSVNVRLPIMLAARLVELEAALLTAKASE